MKLSADEFNAKYPVGTFVRYWPVLPPDPECPPVETRTRTPAWTLGHGEPVVTVEGRTGGVSIKHIELSDALMAGTVWTLNKRGQKVAADPDSRDRTLYEEATRDVIFLFQVRQFVTINDEYLDATEWFHDGETLWIDVDKFSDKEVAEQKAKDNWREEDEDFAHDAISVDDDRLQEEEWAIFKWVTESVWLLRSEAEAFAKAKAYKYGDLGKGCRVYGDLSKGRLADVLSVVQNKDVEEFLQSAAFKDAYTAWRQSRPVKEVANA
jgi:hypothetical protein